MQTHTTRGSFKSQLNKLLDDIENVHWTDNELNLIVNESLYNWGCFGYFKERGEFILQNGNQILDFTHDLLNKDNVPILEQNLTYSDVLDRVCYDLLESLDDVNVFNVFNQSEILQTIDRKLDEFKFQTGLILSVDEFDVTQNLIDLGNNKLDLIRLAFKDISNDDISKWKYYKLFIEDENNLQSFVNKFSVNGQIRPKYYTRIFEDSNFIKLYPPFTNVGRLHIISINGRDKALVPSLSTALNIPDNFIGYVKYGVEADLLQSETPMKDINRAKYCQQRWNEGIIIGKNYNSVLNCEIDGINSNITTLEDLDNFESNWQNSSGTPNKLALAGYNVLATNKKVTKDVSIVLDVIRNAIIPTTDDDFIKVKAEYVETLLYYCYHLAMFKEGFFSLNNSSIFLNQFGNSAMIYNSKLSKEFISYDNLARKSRKQDMEKPRFDRSLTQNATTSA